MPKSAPITTPDTDGESSGFRARLPFLIPLAVFGVLVVYFWIGLGKDPQAIPSVLIDQPVPEFALESLLGYDQGLQSADLKGQISLVNIFGSWCVACKVEHPFLMTLKKDDVIPIYGIDWLEVNRSDGPDWLARYGDPYTLLGDDPNSQGAIAFGVTGAPETFVVDAEGIIRYKYTGPITAEVWRETVGPVVDALRAEQ